MPASRAAATTTCRAASSPYIAATSTEDPVSSRRLMLTRTIDNIVNRGLPRSPRARELVAQLKGRSVAIGIDGFARVRVESDGTLVHVATASGPAAADATI